MILIKALIVIVGLSLLTFWFARKPVTERAIDHSDFIRRRNLWIALTILAFAAHNFWIYISVTALIAAFGVQRESNRLAMFIALMMVVPSFGATVPGVGPIRELMTLSHVRMLSVVLLLPAFLAIRRRPEALPIGRNATDLCLLGYLLLQFVLQFTAVSFTATIRLAIYSFTDIFLPYYVASRGLREMNDYRDALTSFVLAILLMAPLAAFEYLRHWLLYSDLASAMGIQSQMTSYMTRGENLRAVVTADHSIALGYLAVVALGCFVYVQQLFRGRTTKAVFLISLVSILIVSGARGPWVGAIALLGVFLLTGPHKLNRIVKAGAVLLPTILALSLTEFGLRLYALLPFIGTTESGSVDYRQRLFDISVPVILQHPWFGAFDYLVNPNMQELIQGEGIIDVVNTYLGVALTFGGVGLALFCGVFVFSGFRLWTMMQRENVISEMSLLGRALLATMTGILVTIVSVSSISVIAWVYWLFAGLCVGYSQLQREPSKVFGETQTKIPALISGS